MKTKKIKSAIPIYLACSVWIIAGLTCRIYMGRNILIALVISAGVYFAAEKLFPGRTVQVREKANSGNRDIDQQIEDGRRLLDSLRASNEAIPDAEISANLDRMVQAGEAIFAALEKDVRRADQVRRFMNYYLPTADKLLRHYRELDATGSRGENIRTALESVERSLGMIAAAFEKQLDCLYRDESLDIQTDIDALETILATEGLGETKRTMTTH